MILAGIDEAGYGPLLGPLVVGCCAFEVADADPGVDPPCLWQRLTKYLSKNRLKSGKKLHVNDSKAVYSPGQGLKELERSILTLLAAMHTSDEWCDDLAAMLQLTCGQAVPDLDQYDWYHPLHDEKFPFEQDGLSLKLFANALRTEMGRTQTRCVHLHARVVAERQFNHLVNRTRNKGNALFSISSIHLDHLVRTFGQQGLTIFCDRQGGREHYGPLLRAMFDDENWDFELTFETEPRSEYRLHKGGHCVRIIFCEKAEAQCMPVAIASMLSKYLREVLMRRFNAWWRTHLPDVRPTAGYYTDGERFLKDIDVKRRELKISDELLIRCR